MAVTKELLDRLGRVATVAETAQSETATVATEDLVTLLRELADNSGLQIMIGLTETALIGMDLGRFTRIVTFKAPQAEEIGEALVRTARMSSTVADVLSGAVEPPRH